jgi:hypothetical protein
MPSVGAENSMRLIVVLVIPNEKDDLPLTDQN